MNDENTKLLIEMLSEKDKEINSLKEKIKELEKTIDEIYQ